MCPFCSFRRGFSGPRVPRIGGTTRQQGPEEVLVERGAREGHGGGGGGSSGFLTNGAKETKLKKETREIFPGEGKRVIPPPFPVDCPILPRVPRAWNKQGRWGSCRRVRGSDSSLGLPALPEAREELTWLPLYLSSVTGVI